MFLIIVITVSIAVTIKAYSKLTCGICKSSKHLVGKVVIVTGANTGIGYETAKDMSERGARVIMACRNEARATAAREKIVSLTGNSDVHYRHLDLSSLTSVRKFAEGILASEKRLDILINNAGMFQADKVITEDGLPYVMQSNHFGHFLLTNLLLPLIKRSAPSRIINVSSRSHTTGEINFQTLNAQEPAEGYFKKYQVYSNTKLCNVLMTIELAQRLRGTGVTVNCLCPGAVLTDIMNNNTLFKVAKPLFMLFAKTCWEGAQTTIHLAVSREVNDISGAYFRDCKQKSTTKLAQDTKIARKLWEVSEELVKLK